jgi:hypothetical protein
MRCQTVNQHDHSISWMLAGGLRAQEERDRGFLRAVAEARAAQRGPGLVDRIRARFERPAAAAACCGSPAAA